MWLACETMEAIAAVEGVTKETVSTICQKMADLPKSDKSAAEHATDLQRLEAAGEDDVFFRKIWSRGRESGLWMSVEPIP